MAFGLCQPRRKPSALADGALLNTHPLFRRPPHPALWCKRCAIRKDSHQAPGLGGTPVQAPVFPVRWSGERRCLAMAVAGNGCTLGCDKVVGGAVLGNPARPPLSQG
jgi:hypothetical protein